MGSLLSGWRAGIKGEVLSQTGPADMRIVFFQLTINHLPASTVNVRYMMLIVLPFFLAKWAWEVALAHVAALSRRHAL